MVIFVNSIIRQSSKTGFYKKVHGNSLERNMETNQSIITQIILLDLEFEFLGTVCWCGCGNGTQSLCLLAGSAALYYKQSTKLKYNKMLPLLHLHLSLPFLRSRKHIFIFILNNVFYVSMYFISCK
jgi:hypothetical protein